MLPAWYAVTYWSDIYPTHCDFCHLKYGENPRCVRFALQRPVGLPRLVGYPDLDRPHEGDASAEHWRCPRGRILAHVDGLVLYDDAKEDVTVTQVSIPSPSVRGVESYLRL